MLWEVDLHPGTEVTDVGTGHVDIKGTLFRSMRVTRHCIRQRVISTSIRMTVDTRDWSFPGKERAPLGTG